MSARFYNCTGTNLGNVLSQFHNLILKGSVVNKRVSDGGQVTRQFLHYAKEFRRNRPIGGINTIGGASSMINFTTFANIVTLAC